MDDHERLPSFQVTFSSKVNEFVVAMEEMGNPFIKARRYLFALGYKDIVGKDIVSTVQGIIHLGQQQYNNLIEEHFLKGVKPIPKPIKRNKLAPFSNQKPPSIKQTRIGDLKSDLVLFARL